MFKPLGLFAPSQCPDPNCRRQQCFFSHAKAASTILITSVIHSKTTAKDLDAAPKSILKRKPEVAEVPNLSPVKRVRAEEDKKTVPHAGAATSKESVSTSVSKPPPRAAPPPQAVPGNLSRPPMLPTNLKASPQPYADRQKGLTTLYTQFSKLYAQILAESPQLAHEHSLEQEAETSKGSSTAKIYKTAIHQAAVSISRRPIPDKLNHPSVGTIRESRIAYEKHEKEKAGALTRERVERYCLPLSDFEKWRYPLPSDPAILGIGGEEPDAEGTSQTCNRCKVSFIVSSKDLDKRFGECKYHYGRMAPERIEGRRKWIYSCCRKERGEAGCEEGIHVFSDGDDDGSLAKRVGWKSTKEIAGETGMDGGVDIVGMDCEMISTTAGSSLARVTIVDKNGEILLDELVRQTVPILDVNTRFSGIQPGQLDAAIMDLTAVRAAACAFIGPDTIMVGHGLENDLRALRLSHDKIIDTAVVFPHDKGVPYRRALRDIVKEKLGYFIQDRTADLGHSSAVDAQSTLEILKWKVRDDQT